VVLLRKSIPQNHNLNSAVYRGVNLEKKMENTKILVLGFIFFIVSCAPIYKTNKTSSSPKVSMGLSSVDAASICVDNKKYSASTLTEGKSLFLEANKQVTLQLGITFTGGSSMVTVRNSCSANSTFIPLSNGEYKVEFVYEYDFVSKRPLFEKGCKVEIKKIEGSKFEILNSNKPHDNACEIK
jgi:hypothetical protein